MYVPVGFVNLWVGKPTHKALVNFEASGPVCPVPSHILRWIFVRRYNALFESKKKKKRGKKIVRREKNGKKIEKIVTRIDSSLFYLLFDFDLFCCFISSFHDCSLHRMEEKGTAWYEIVVRGFIIYFTLTTPSSGTYWVLCDTMLGGARMKMLAYPVNSRNPTTCALQ